MEDCTQEEVLACYEGWEDEVIQLAEVCYFSIQTSYLAPQ